MDFYDTRDEHNYGAALAPVQIVDQIYGVTSPHCSTLLSCNILRVIVVVTWAAVDKWKMLKLVHVFVPPVALLNSDKRPIPCARHPFVCKHWLKSNVVGTGMRKEYLPRLVLQC